jgi:hypothetical protein
MSAAASAPPHAAGFVGRCFVGPWFDYTFIGAAASLPVLVVVLYGSTLPGLAGIAAGVEQFAGPDWLPWMVLVFSMTHFAASTVRLYTKPGAMEALPFATRVLPLVFLVGLAICVAASDVLGHPLQALYLTWSPYHYAAQAYGLAVMYCVRSGCALDARTKGALRFVALAPFAYVFVAMPGIGLHWLLPDAVQPALGTLAAGLGPALIGVSVAGPLLLFGALARRATPMPLIAPLLMLVNALWWIGLAPSRAFLWATFFHGLQYLAIVVIFHVRERRARTGRQGWWWHAAGFYGVCLVLGYALFSCLPQAFVLAGASTTESLLLVIAAVNIHHFVVDGFIWKLGRSDANRVVVESAAALAPAR